jgi:ElaB/YqjD/DUF883 family membrane-anchored ribosome-binding protein
LEKDELTPEALEQVDATRKEFDKELERIQQDFNQLSAEGEKLLQKARENDPEGRKREEDRAKKQEEARAKIEQDTSQLKARGAEFGQKVAKF